MRILRLTTLCLAFALALSAPLSAQKPTPVIAAATVSADQSTLFISGSGFGSTPPTVTLGGFYLGGVTVNSLGTQATAGMPAMSSGSYQLTVQVGNNKSVAFEMAVGAEGPAGPTGPAGPAGANGANGADGADGAPGAAGPAGAVGPAGPNGAVGPTGPQGANGADGAAGPAGPAGAVGPSGADGAVGAAGPQGPQGANGADGAPGAVGPQGPQGFQGPQGLQGPAGADGAGSSIGTFFASAPGNDPVTGSTVAFIGATVNVTVSTGQKVHVTSNKALGSSSVGGGTGLNLFICSQSTVAGSPIAQVGAGSFGLTAPQGQRHLFGLSTVITGLAPGTYTVGLCGYGTNFNSNEYGYTTALVF